jgi:hypothetical protein
VPFELFSFGSTHERVVVWRLDDGDAFGDATLDQFLAGQVLAIAREVQQLMVMSLPAMPIL